MRHILFILMSTFCLIGGLLGTGGCSVLQKVNQFLITDHYIVVIDQTDSTKELRNRREIYQFLRALGSRPNLDVELYGMMPDRIYSLALPHLEDALKMNFGRIDDGTCTSFTGGDLQHVISLFENEEKGVIIITDGENNFGNTQTCVPTFLHPGKFYLVGIRDDLYEQYRTVRGLHLCSISGVEELTKQLVVEDGRLRDFDYGGQT